MNLIDAINKARKIKQNWILARDGKELIKDVLARIKDMSEAELLSNDWKVSQRLCVAEIEERQKQKKLIFDGIYETQVKARPAGRAWQVKMTNKIPEWIRYESVSSYDENHFIIKVIIPFKGQVYIKEANIGDWIYEHYSNFADSKARKEEIYQNWGDIKILRVRPSTEFMGVYKNKLKKIADEPT
jgi:hypothetical protein